MKQDNQTVASAHSSPFKNVKEVEANARSRMDKVLADLQGEMAHFRTGRASINLLDSVRVEYYGSPVPLNQVAQLHVPEPALITVQPWDTSTIREIEKAIRQADLGLNPSNDGKIVRVPIPPLTEERRRDLAKKLSHFAEERRVNLRNIRRDANDHLKKLSKDKLISGDEERQALESIQKLTDGQIAKLDQVAKAKEKEILEFK
ncbi:MAG: ribosome recycling factor [Acidobacteriaceae bacterium]|nr:ribosome recycling factor [Acidobacteriaceae bacterium]MBV9037114.1 ribosome recycling factor [Acidobacteriaceae bacterium]MBV9222719.1 ribosome recycling factor [Acidobacteriaceae bacterium]MBV9306656.1 ribosome recycling factor [Acidobacteriaceae bacterium]MBV9675907.1 ribosome recycling factor [Acidobacteriaceae bacterium]